MTDSRTLAAKVAVGAAWTAGFGWQLYGGLTNLIFFTGLATAAREQLSAFAWVVLIAGLAIPVLGFVTGATLGARRSAGGLALVLLAAFCSSEALTLSVLAIFQSASGVA